MFQPDNPVPESVEGETERAEPAMDDGAEASPSSVSTETAAGPVLEESGTEESTDPIAMPRTDEEEMEDASRLLDDLQLGVEEPVDGTSDSAVSDDLMSPEFDPVDLAGDGAEDLIDLDEELDKP